MAVRYHNLQTQGFVDGILPISNKTMQSCDPRNQAHVWLASGSGVPSPNANLRQRYPLALLYISWNGQTWRANEGWLTSSNKCTLSGVWCDIAGGWYCNDQNFNGNLGFEIAFLTNLPSLSLLQNSSHGSLSSDLRNLFKLATLALLTKNRLTGTLPTEMGVMSSLTELHLSF